MSPTVVLFRIGKSSPRRQKSSRSQLEVVRYLPRLVGEQHMQAFSLAAVGAAFEAEPAFDDAVPSDERNTRLVRGSHIARYRSPTLGYKKWSYFKKTHPYSINISRQIQIDKVVKIK